MHKEIEDTKVVVRSRKSMKDRQHNGREKKDKRTNSYLQNTTKHWRSSNTNITKNRGILVFRFKSINNPPPLSPHIGIWLLPKIDTHLDMYSDIVTCSPLHLTLLELTLDRVNFRWTNENSADNVLPHGEFNLGKGESKNINANIVVVSWMLIQMTTVHVDVYSKQLLVIKCVSDLRQVGRFLQVLRSFPPIKLTTTI